MRLLKDQDLSNKNVVVRLDLNVPIQDKQIIDSTRIISSVPTIKYLVNKNCKVLLTSHVMLKGLYNFYLRDILL